MILVVFTKTGLQNQLGKHCVQQPSQQVEGFGQSPQSNMTKDVEFGGAQILDIVFQKWFLVDLSFQVLELEEDDESDENSPTKAKRRNLSLGLGVQSKATPMDMDESPNPVAPKGETKHPQQNEIEPKIILPTLRSWTLGWLQLRFQSSALGKCTLVE